MHIGRLFCANREVDLTPVFSEWMSRQADNAVFTVELVYAVHATLTVTVFQKNSEETGPGTSAGTVVSSTSTPGLHKATITGLAEMVRFAVLVEGAEAEFCGLVYRVLPTTWFDTARV